MGLNGEPDEELRGLYADANRNAVRKAYLDLSIPLT